MNTLTKFPQKTLNLQYENAPDLETLVNPEEANITIAIITDTRQTGTHRMAHLITSLLRREGYVNVKVEEELFNPEVLYGKEALVEKQRHVPILVRAGIMATSEPTIQIDLMPGGCGYDVGNQPVVIENKHLKSV